MKKLTLDMDTIRVESFVSSPSLDGPGGTVRAHELEVAAASVSYCQSCFTQFNSCVGPLTACRCA